MAPLYSGTAMLSVAPKGELAKAFMTCADGVESVSRLMEPKVPAVPYTLIPETPGTEPPAMRRAELELTTTGPVPSGVPLVPVTCTTLVRRLAPPVKVLLVPDTMR